MREPGVKEFQVKMVLPITTLDGFVEGNTSGGGHTAVKGNQRIRECLSHIRNVFVCAWNAYCVKYTNKEFKVQDALGTLERYIGWRSNGKDIIWDFSIAGPDDADPIVLVNSIQSAFVSKLSLDPSMYTLTIT